MIEDKGKKGAMTTNKAIFAAGCFWGVEAEYRMVRGVVATQVGYTGGLTPDPTYEERFWRLHDPTQVNRQGWDIGDQYRTAIFTLDEGQAATATASRERAQQRFRKPIATRIEPAGAFYRAEEYHQQYLEKRGQASCVIPAPATKTSSHATTQTSPATVKEA
jgi:peptide-methionine (S)-S-oxide reductase